MNTHSPGPFPLSLFDRGEGTIVVTTNQGNHYATTFDPAAARFIQSAPDMLSALRVGLDFVIEQRNAGLDVDHEFDILSAAIQQATHP